MKILFFIPDGLPTFRPDITALFGKYLLREGLRSDLVAQRADDSAGEPAWPAGRALLAPRSASRLRNQLSFLLHCIAVLRSVKAQDCDAVQVRDMPVFAYLAMRKARRLKLPFFYWMSFPMSEASLRLASTQGMSLGLVRYVFTLTRGHLGQFLLDRFVLPGADHVFVQSDQMRIGVSAQGIDAGKITPAPMCVDPERFAEPLPSQAESAFPGRRVIGYLGACDRVRRIDFLVDVVAALRERRPEVLLLLVGDAAEEQDRQSLRQQIEEGGLTDHVHVTGWLPADAAQAQFAAAEVGLALVPPDPLLDVGSPTKLVEYLAMEKPVVANDHPDQSKVVRESGGGLCVPFEVQRFADAVDQLLAAPEAAREMGRKGRAYVLQARSYPVLARQLAEVYRALLRR